MDISRRVLFGAVAGGIVAAQKLFATERVTKTEREVLVEKLMQPICDLDPDHHRRCAHYREHFITWNGWRGKRTPEEGRPGILGHAYGTWSAADPKSASDRKDHVMAFATWYDGDKGWDRTVDEMLDSRRRTLNTLLDLIEGNS